MQVLSTASSPHRCVDSTTGQTYHPVYAPPPEGLHERLVWRVDDTPEVLSRRLAEHRHSCADIVRTFEGARVPFRRIDTARSELDCFREVATFLEGVALGKVSQYRDYLVRQRRLEDAAEGWGEEGARVLYRGYGGRRLQEGSLPTSADTWQEAMAALAGGVSDFREGDVEALCEPGEEEGTCIVRYYEEAATRESDVVGTLLAAVRRCNEYVPGAFVPVVAAGEQVGWVDAATREALAPQLAAGYACRYVDIALSKANPHPHPHPIPKVRVPLRRLAADEQRLECERQQPRRHCPRARASGHLELRTYRGGGYSRGRACGGWPHSGCQGE
jgi:hypothetical protein